MKGSYGENQSLQEIMNELPSDFLDYTFRQSMEGLLKMKQRHHCYNRLAVINARIEKLNYLSY